MKRLIVFLAAAAMSSASLFAGDFKDFIRRPEGGTHAVFFNSSGYGWNIGLDMPSSNVSLKSRFLSDMFWDIAGVKTYSRSGFFNFYTGIGLGYSSYRANPHSAFGFHPATSGDLWVGTPLYCTPVRLGDSKVSALRNFYLYIPADFTFRIARRVSIFAGIQGELNFKSWLVNESRASSLNAGWHRSKIEGLSNRQFTYSVKAGMMFSHFGFYVKYRPVTVFREDYGPQFKTMSVGFIFQ